MGRMNEASNMTGKNLTEQSLERDNLFRKFQAEKFSRKKAVPCVSMMIDINIDRLEDVRRTYNVDIPNNEHVTFTNVTFIAIRNTYRNYGNFPVTNFGSFGAKIGIPIVSSPIIAVLCLGMIQRVSSENTGKMPNPATILPITIVFDHRPIDGAYCGRFLNSLKSLVENNADSLFI